MTRVVAWLLLAATVVLAGAWVGVSEHETSYGELQAAVSEGDVDEVALYGSTAPYRGRLTVQVRWATGPLGAFHHATSVLEERPLRDRWRSRIVVGDVGADLAALDPDLVVVRHDDGPDRAAASAFGRPVPLWFVVVSALVWLGVFVLLISGSPPWRATRWAWFWVLGMVPPVGVVLFLLLSGRTGRWPPSRPEARLRGGWAFLIAFAVNSVVQTSVNAGVL